MKIRDVREYDMYVMADGTIAITCQYGLSGRVTWQEDLCDPDRAWETLIQDDGA